MERRVDYKKKLTESRDCQERYNGDDDALLDKEVLEGGADRRFAVWWLFLLLVAAREPASHLAGSWLVR